MTDKRLMYGNSPEQMVWLVWHLVKDRPTLAVIRTTDEDLFRYVTRNKKAWLNGAGAVFVEKVMTNHLYGATDVRLAARIMGNT